MDGRVPAGILSVVVIALAFASDRWVPGSLLSLPLLISTLVASLTAWIGIPRLRELKMGQIIREDGPQAHLSKAGTPTMGGLLVVPVGVVIGALVSVSDGNANRLLAVAAITLAFMLIGGMDDWRSLTRQTNTGLTPLGKLVLQAGAASIFLAVAFWQGWISTTIALPMGLDLPFGWLILPLGLFVFLAESNATNLTDGLDGLAAGCGALVFSGMGLQLTLRGNNGDPALAGIAGRAAQALGDWSRAVDEYERAAQVAVRPGEAWRHGLISHFRGDIATAGAAYRAGLRTRLGRHLRHTGLAARLFRSTLPVEVSVRAAAQDPRVLGDLCEFALSTGVITPSMVWGLTRRWARDLVA